MKVTICMTQGPAEPSVAVALLLPAVVTILSSAISPSGEVMMRDVNPLPAAPVKVATMFAPKISSFALSSSPLRCSHSYYSRSPLPSHPVSSLLGIPDIRTSGYAAAWLNVTVTVLLPPTMFAA